MFKTDTNYKFIESHIIKHIPRKEYKKNDIVIYNKKFYTIIELLDNNIEILDIQYYKISDKITITKNDTKLQTINEKKIYQKLSELIKFVKDYNLAVCFLNKRDLNIKTLDDKNINDLIFLLLNTNVKISTLNKILFGLKKSHDDKYEITKLFINPYDFIEETNSYISFKLAEKIEDLWKLKINFNIKLKAKIKSVIIENYSSNSSFYIKKHEFYKKIKDYCISCNESYNNYKQFIDDQIMLINFPISKIKLQELGNSKIGFGNNKEYTMKYTHEKNETLIKWCNDLTNPSQQIQEYMKYVNGKETFITSEYFWNLEKELTQKIIKLYSEDSENSEGYDKEEVYNFITKFEKKRTKEKNSIYKFDAIQKQAIFEILNNKFSILTGPPGSGKTDIVGCVLYIMEEYCDEEELLLNKTCIMAPTGQAYNQIRNSIQSKYYYSKISGTCHKILYNIFQKKCYIENKNENETKYKDENEDVDEEFNNCKFNFVIIDEFSMIDLNILKLILQLCEKYNNKLLVIGDPKQFPPIGPGNPLLSLIQSKKFNICNLVNIYRQQENTSLLNMIQKMNKGEKITDCDFTDEFAKFIDISNKYEKLRNNEFLKNFIYEIIDTYGLNRDTKFLCYNTSNAKLENGNTKFIFNVPVLNNIIQDRFNPNKEGFENEIINYSNYDEKEFRVGDKIIRTENEYDGEYMRANGEEAEILEYNDEKADDEKVTIRYSDGDEKTCNISINKLYEEFDLNYATGFHKSQGSGWKTIVVFIEPNAGFIKQKAIYTGISRSKEKLLLICRPEDLLKCQNPEDERTSLFMNKIHY